MKKILNLHLVTASSVAISIVSCIYFYTNSLTLFYYDASSRLNIARKVIDNLTPGLGQLGTLWLPFPQILTLPLIWNDWWWHTGLAGSVISMLSFIISNVYIYKMVLLFGKDKLAAVIACLVLMTNINILYIQATPMSEMFFVMTVFGSMYYFIKWVLLNKLSDLILMGIYVALCTFSRYEGYFLFAASLLVVGLVLILRRSKFLKIEGTVVVFAFIAGLGIFLWTLYQTAIFNDPFYWAKIYTGRASIISTESENRGYASGINTRVMLPWKTSIVRYFNTSAQVNGILLIYSTSVLAYLSVGYFLLLHKNQRLSLLALFLPLAVFVFIVFSIKQGFPLDTPSLTINSIFDQSNYSFKEYNIRYGLNFLPFYVLLVGVLATLSKYYKVLLFTVIVIQAMSINSTKYYLQYNIPRYFLSINPTERVENRPSVVWLKEHYDGGLIMISALKHDPTMFYLGLPYKTYIHEGTQYYWTESIKNPQTYARWIYMYKSGLTDGKEEDSTTKELKNNPNLLKYFIQEYEDNEIMIYKKKYGNS